jgi:hypothetical protein
MQSYTLVLLKQKQKQRREKSKLNNQTAAENLAKIKIAQS